MTAQGNHNQQQARPPSVQDSWDLGLGFAAISYLLGMAVLCLMLLISGWPIATERTSEVCLGLNTFVNDLPTVKQDKEMRASKSTKENQESRSEVLAKEIAGACAREVQKAFGWEALQKLSREQVLILIIASAGAIGGAAYGLRSSVWHLGVSDFKKCWVAWYFVQPFLGAALGVLTYLVVRAGFINPSSSDALNPFGFVAIAGLVGLFTENAFAHLKDVAASVLRKAEKEKDGGGTP
jgi:hypothetical protein